MAGFMTIDIQGGDEINRFLKNAEKAWADANPPSPLFGHHAKKAVGRGFIPRQGQEIVPRNASRRPGR